MRLYFFLSRIKIDCPAFARKCLTLGHLLAGCSLRVEAAGGVPGVEQDLTL